MKKKVVVGMSGGVDSSVAAYILKEQGYDVIGVTMQIWQDEDKDELENNGGCCGLSAVCDAQRVAHRLDIPFYVLNFKNSFKENVIDYFIDEYINGRTPNPCIACNRYVKWESFLKKSMEIGADYIATGHYARIEKNSKTRRYSIKYSATKEKDQTYALYNLTQHQLKKTLMPVGDFTKEEIRDIAKKIDLSVANKPDSQEICFIPDDNYAKFIKENSNIPIKKGNFVDICGNVLGKHEGIAFYTIGQRKGLGVTFGKPMYVKKINTNDNTIVLAENDKLFEKNVLASNVNFMAIEEKEGEFTGYGKIRYSNKPSPCKCNYKNGILDVIFLEPQRAITPGQAIVIYDEENILCGGSIV